MKKSINLKNIILIVLFFISISPIFCVSNSFPDESGLYWRYLYYPSWLRIEFKDHSKCCSSNCIWFNSNGTQPSDIDARKYSCANVDNTEITNWYKKMFGLEEKAKGFDRLGSLKQIPSSTRSAQFLFGLEYCPQYYLDWL